ncbi:hypothetical protein CHLNCDRAFT_138864 [Chlorella variabilis]|uniref:FAS1 domain-containing protein n=1 Tax=Chlorella variabilis TaxID=554065 RepID=E1ZP79_CHLVA|nr:hypothetical protein CHLNCDRAFT_138864 [Chlorella variabilis]EFN52492.1 hypothetical protein CHLNCDRAFT_138864 [Chlorella variabilis]|eukprot:XP_005844594.1 hypothetical protein CHLNCDRAFT_138864 [Chlorella variabilis]
MGLGSLLVLLPLLFPGAAAARHLSQGPVTDGQPACRTVAEWAAATGHTYFAESVQTFAPELYDDAFSDPAWVGTIFSLTNAVLDMSGQLDDLGDFRGVMGRAANDSAYFDGMRQIILYHIHPDEALTEAELVYTAARGGNLTTALPGHDLGLEPLVGPQGTTLLLVPEDPVLTNLIGKPRVVKPDVTAGQAIVHELDMVLLPVLE